MAAYEKTDIQKVIDQEIVPGLREVLRERVGFTARVLDKSAYAVEGIETIHFPYRDKRVAQSTTVTGSLNAVAGARKRDSLDLSIVLGDAFTLSRHLAKEANARIAEEELSEIVNAIMQARDQRVYTVLNAAAFHTVERTTSIMDDIADMRKKLRDNKVPVQTGEVTLGLNNSDFAKVTKSDDFAKVDSFGSKGEQLKSEGVVGKIYGMNVMEHDYAESLAFHKNAAAFADHGELLVMKAENPLEMGDTFSVSLKGNAKALHTDGENSPYIVKLVDPAPAP